MKHPTVNVRDTCVFCGRMVQQLMPMDAYTAWRSGTLIQKAWPGSTEDERCRAMGTHPECWGPDPDDEPLDTHTSEEP